MAEYRPKPPRRQIAAGALIVLVLSLSGCASIDALDRATASGELERTRIAAGGFELALIGRPLPERVDVGTGRLVVYLGSDGRPWRDRRPAADPTGRRALALDLMRRDPRPAVYLGRPCYHGTADAPPCTSRLWTSGRYSTTVVDALAAGLRALIARHEPSELTLVGYSGGGTLAVLAASNLSAEIDVEVITIAANLDPAAWTAFHGLLPLSASLNPVEAVPSPARFRQLHLVGTADLRVPVQTIRRYRERQPDAKVLEVEGFDHVCCWVRDWPTILAEIATR
ncbi:hypothetical protein [Halomonas denitrificans]|nr:hypothetical protein [Halomonas denitrificans]